MLKEISVPIADSEDTVYSPIIVPENNVNEQVAEFQQVINLALSEVTGQLLTLKSETTNATALPVLISYARILLK
jgi:hypothetical protein